MATWNQNNLIIYANKNKDVMRKTTDICNLHDMLELQEDLALVVLLFSFLWVVKQDLQTENVA